MAKNQINHQVDVMSKLVEGLIDKLLHLKALKILKMYDYVNGFTASLL
jgi:hypothetical protein